MGRSGRMSVEELAAKTGMTVRNVRNYQTKGLIPPPELDGRKGVYGEEHRTRLELIKEMQSAGFNLTAIKKLLDRVPEGAGGEALRLERALLSPWSEEEPEVVSVQELSERFGAPPADALRRAEEMGVIRLLEGGVVELPVPSLVRAGEEVVALGIPFSEVLAVTEQLVRSSNEIAGTYVDLFIRNVWEPFDRAGRPAEEWPKVRSALESVRPLASQALLAAFQARMRDAVEEAVGSRLSAGEADLAAG